MTLSEFISKYDLSVYNITDDKLISNKQSNSIEEANAVLVGSRGEEMVAKYLESVSVVITKGIDFDPKVKHVHIEGGYLALFSDRDFNTLMEKAKSFSGAMFKHMKTGAKFASKELQEKRWGVCNECPFYEAHRNKCKKCGCGLRGKIRLESTNCPIKKW